MTKNKFNLHVRFMVVHPSQSLREFISGTSIALSKHGLTVRLLQTDSQMTNNAYQHMKGSFV